MGSSAFCTAHTSRVFILITTIVQSGYQSYFRPSNNSKGSGYSLLLTRCFYPLNCCSLILRNLHRQLCEKISGNVFLHTEQRGGGSTRTTLFMLFVDEYCIKIICSSHNTMKELTFRFSRVSQYGRCPVCPCWHGTRGDRTGAVADLLKYACYPSSGTHSRLEN